jgi:hypothetical protein
VDSTDHDPLFQAHRWTANLRILEIDEIKTVPQVPLSHPFVERLIGAVPREFLDHVLFWNARDLERKLADFPGLLQGGTRPRVIVRTTRRSPSPADTRWLVPSFITICVGSSITGTWSRSQWRPDNEFETDRQTAAAERL